MANTACAPRARTSLLDVCRCPRNAVTGPGPLGGGSSRTPAETHPTDGLGAKSGFKSAAAPKAKLPVNASALRLAEVNNDSFGSNDGFGTLISTQGPRRVSD